MIKVITAMFLLNVVSFFGSGPARADLLVRTQAEVGIELTGFDGLGEATISKGEPCRVRFTHHFLFSLLDLPSTMWCARRTLPWHNENFS